MILQELEPIRIDIDDRDVGILGHQVFRHRRADLPRSEDKDLHADTSIIARRDGKAWREPRAKGPATCGCFAAGTREFP